MLITGRFKLNISNNTFNDTREIHGFTKDEILEIKETLSTFKSEGTDDIKINEYLRRNTHPKFEEQAKKTLSYFDIMNLAPLIKSYTWISSGLIDEVTPPSTIFAAYNHLKCQKEISVHRYFGHEYIPSTVEPKLRLMMDLLQ